MNRTLVPASAAIYVVTLAASIGLDGEAPDSGTTSGTAVLAFYSNHHAQMIASAVVVVISAVAVMVCLGAIREFLVREPRSRALATTALVGGAVYAASLCLSAGAALALTDSTSRLEPATAQTLSLLRSDVNGPFAAAGTALVLGGFGWAMLQGTTMPRWLAWVAVAFGLVALVPGLAILAVLVAAVWLVVVAVLIYRRLGSSDVLEPANS